MPMGQAQKAGCSLILNPHRRGISSTLAVPAGSSASTQRSRVPELCPHLHLHHPVHKDGTHVPTDVCLLLHVVRKQEFFLPKSQL